MAAVGCTTWLRFPPSRSNPARMPPSPISTPPQLALSTIHSLLSIRRSCLARGRRRGGRVIPAEGEPLQHGPPERNDALQHLLRTFPYHDLFPVQQRDHGIRRLLYELDQV